MSIYERHSFLRRRRRVSELADVRQKNFKFYSISKSLLTTNFIKQALWDGRWESCDTVGIWGPVGLSGSSALPFPYHEGSSLLEPQCSHLKDVDDGAYHVVLL